MDEGVPVAVAKTVASPFCDLRVFGVSYVEAPPPAAPGARVMGGDRHVHRRRRADRGPHRRLAGCSTRSPAAASRLVDAVLAEAERPTVQAEVPAADPVAHWSGATRAVLLTPGAISSRSGSATRQ